MDNNVIFLLTIETAGEFEYAMKRLSDKFDPKREKLPNPENNLDKYETFFMTGCGSKMCLEIKKHNLIDREKLIAIELRDYISFFPDAVICLKRLSEIDKTGSIVKQQYWIDSLGYTFFVGTDNDLELADWRALNNYPTRATWLDIINLWANDPSKIQSDMSYVIANAENGVFKILYHDIHGKDGMRFREFDEKDDDLVFVIIDNKRESYAEKMNIIKKITLNPVLLKPKKVRGVWKLIIGSCFE